MRSKYYLKVIVANVLLLAGILSSCDNKHELWGQEGFTWDMANNLASGYNASSITMNSAKVSYYCVIPIGMDWSQVGIKFRPKNYSNWTTKYGSYSGGYVTVNLSDLRPGTEYEICAIIQSDGRTYESNSSYYYFSTLSPAEMVITDVTDPNPSSTTSNARVYFSVSSKTTMSEIGVCIGQSSNPTISQRTEYRYDSRSFDDWWPVEKGKQFYARPYCKDSNGNVYYGDQVTFNTIAITNSFSVTNTSYYSQYYEGTYYYYHYTLNCSFSYYGKNLSETDFYVTGYGSRYWTETMTGERTGSWGMMSVDNPSPFSCYAYAKLTDGTVVYGLTKTYTINYW